MFNGDLISCWQLRRHMALGSGFFLSIPNGLPSDSVDRCHGGSDRRNLLVSVQSTTWSKDGVQLLQIDRFIPEGFGFHEFTNHVFMPPQRLHEWKKINTSIDFLQNQSPIDSWFWRKTNLVFGWKMYFLVEFLSKIWKMFWWFRLVF